MRYNDWVIPTLLVTLLSPVLVLTSSTRPPSLHPLALSHPTAVDLTILPRSIPISPIPSHQQHVIRRGIDPDRLLPEYDDAFLLVFTSHSTEFKLALRPSKTLLHPDGIESSETLTDEKGDRRTVEKRMGAEEVRVYEGVVLEEGTNVERWLAEERAGLVRPQKEGEEGGRNSWARIVILPVAEGEESEGEVRFQGSFDSPTQGGLYTIHSTRNYVRTREVLDPDPPVVRKRNFGEGEEGGKVEWGHPEMVIVKENHVMTPREQVTELRKRGLAIPSWEESERLAAGSSCGHDTLDFNLDPEHPVFTNPSELDDYDSFSSLETTWAHTLFGMPSRSPPPSSLFYPSDRTSPVSSSSSLDATSIHTHPRQLGKRQSGGDISGGSNISSNFINSIGSTAGCPKTAMVVFVGIAADCTYVNHYGSADLARTQILTDINSVSALYSSSFNISLGIVSLNVQSGPCPTSQSAVDPANPWNVGCTEGGSPGLALNERLSVFSQWRGTKSPDRAGLWHLLTNCSSGTEVGVAWLGQLCRTDVRTSQGQSTSGTAVTAITRSVWQVIAHETGHSFGAIHDCAAGCSLTNSNPICCPLSSSTCDASANFLMSPVSRRDVTNFSPCSIGNICTSLSSSLNTSCLAVPGAPGNPSLISLQSCGNGILEDGEDCDPGSSTTDTCCNARTCKFAPGAQCDPLNSLCCTPTCQIAAKGTVCRPSIDRNCDVAEVCQGTNSTCPVDVYEADGKSCGGDGLACASGICTSRSLQCQTAGASLSLTAACPIRASSSCSVTCADPRSSSACIVLEQNFRNGSPCGYAGTCQNSVCRSGSPIAVAESWYRENLQISIPVTVVVGLLVLGALIAIYRCCARKRRNNQQASSTKFNSNQLPPAPLQNSFFGGRTTQYPPPPHHNQNFRQPVPPSRRSGNQNSQFNGGGNVAGGGAYEMGGLNGYSGGGGGGWVDPSAYNGPHHNGRY